jgi:hypothetical protein
LLLKYSIWQPWAAQLENSVGNFDWKTSAYLLKNIFECLSLISIKASFRINVYQSEHPHVLFLNTDIRSTYRRFLFQSWFFSLLGIEFDPWRKTKLSWMRKLPHNWEVRGHCPCGNDGKGEHEW